MFSSFRGVVGEEYRKVLIAECEELFTATQRKSGRKYSEGQTFWVDASCQNPRSAIEAFALDVFDHHTRANVKFDRTKSGCEFWPLVIDSLSSDVGAHFDKDYGAREDIYPFLATVTYLQGCAGAPTMFFDCREDELPKRISRAFVSFVEEGKHVLFDGTLLHCASSEMCATKMGGSSSSRITLLINLWLDHRPVDAVSISEERRSVVWKNANWPSEDVLPIVNVCNAQMIVRQIKMPLDKKRVVRFEVPIGLETSCVLEYGEESVCVFEKTNKKDNKKKKKDKKKKDAKKKKKKKNDDEKKDK
jgi:hypothetical protein